jgi:hypothetical protein
MKIRQIGGWALFVALAGCSSSQTTANEATAQASAEPAPIETAKPAPVETATATATASAAPPPKSGGGGPALKYSGATKVQAPIGSGAAKLELGKDHSVMAIPDGAISSALLLTFMIDDKGKRATGGTGSVYHLFAQNPPAEEPTAVASSSGAFSFKLPVGKGTANLAVGEVTRDASGKESIKWNVIAPKSTEDGFATFEISSFMNDYLQITTAAPSS